MAVLVLMIKRLNQQQLDYSIPKDKPVYLGIVGNGNKNDVKYTSRSIVTSMTGTYLTTNRTVRFIDDAGNKLALDSKILMPRGGRLGLVMKMMMRPITLISQLCLQVTPTYQV